MTTTTRPESTPAVGARIAFRKTMTVAEQAMFTGISGNLGPLHVDAVRARAEGAPGMIAFELAVAALATTCLSRLAGSARRIGRLDLHFAEAVPVGSTIEASAEVLRIDGDAIVCRVVCMQDGGSAVISGEAELVPLGSGG
jgi:3-hydroxybutyryl-CoA dehydratase